MPHPSTLRKVCQGLTVSPKMNGSENFLLYAKMQFKLIKPYERTVTLLIDDKYTIKPYFDYIKVILFWGLLLIPLLLQNVYMFYRDNQCIVILKEVAHVMPVKKND